MLRNVIRLAVVAVALGLAGPVWAQTSQNYHSGNYLLCDDCHSMHFSQSHNWNSASAPSTRGALGGDWLVNQGNPTRYLLKGTDPNSLCLACHDGQTFAPDVFGVNTNTGSFTAGREAGALNDTANSAGGGYGLYMGHRLGSTDTPPGFDPVRLGLSATWYVPLNGLECVSCHAQHGPAGVYRNLGPYSLGNTAPFRPSFVVNTANDTTKDVWINQPSGYLPGGGSSATFAPYYDTKSIWFNRNDSALNGLTASNKISNLCAACHADFHSFPNDALNASGVGASGATDDGWLRHPTGGVTIGASSAGGHSSLTRFQGAVSKVKVSASQSNYSDATPICITCHKAHGNQNPFGLIFLEASATTITEEGSAITMPSGYTLPPTGIGQRYLCGQCHGQGAQ